MFASCRVVSLETKRIDLRPPRHNDWRGWADLRQVSKAFLTQWEPLWSSDHLTRWGFVNRVYWAKKAMAKGKAFPFLLERRDDRVILGAITLDNIRRGPAQSATIGYWVGEQYSRQGYMHEAITAVVDYAFDILDLSRIEAACLPENIASRRVLEKTGFKYEGVAQSYLQINGRWRNHVLYARLRMDRRGKTDAA